MHAILATRLPISVVNITLCRSLFAVFDFMPTCMIIRRVYCGDAAGADFTQLNWMAGLRPQGKHVAASSIVLRCSLVDLALEKRMCQARSTHR